MVHRSGCRQDRAHHRDRYDHRVRALAARKLDRHHRGSGRQRVVRAGLPARRLRRRSRQQPRTHHTERERDALSDPDRRIPALRYCERPRRSVVVYRNRNGLRRSHDDHRQCRRISGSQLLWQSVVHHGRPGRRDVVDRIVHPQLRRCDHPHHDERSDHGVSRRVARFDGRAARYRIGLRRRLVVHRCERQLRRSHDDRGGHVDLCDTHGRQHASVHHRGARRRALVHGIQRK